MKTRLKPLALLLAMVAVLLTLAATPSFATEGGGEDGGGKITLPETQHDQVGLILLGAAGLVALAAAANAVRQLKGERPQADGRIRWR